MSSSSPNLVWRCFGRSGLAIRNWAGEGSTVRKWRYEILLPVRHNSGQPVSGELLEQTREELLAQFDGITIAPHTVLGIWVHEGSRFEEEMRRLTVDVDDTLENQEFLVRYKATLLERFDQIEIYIISYPIDRK